MSIYMYYKNKWELMPPLCYSYQGIYEYYTSLIIAERYGENAAIES